MDGKQISEGCKGTTSLHVSALSNDEVLIGRKQPLGDKNTGEIVKQILISETQEAAGARNR